MALKKQSIRQGVHVLIDGVNTSKEELITLSETWTEKKKKNSYFTRTLYTKRSGNIS